jgi:outer membrane protein TolC
MISLMVMSSVTVRAQVQAYTLSDIMAMAKGQSPLSKQAETRRDNRYWQYRSYKSNYNPQLRMTGDLPGYNNDYFSNRLDDGKIQYQQQKQTNPELALGLEQPIALTGGTISINSDLTLNKDYINDTLGWRGTVVNVQLSQPLLSFNQLTWDRRTEPLRYEESKREYVEEMESISREAVDKFFTVLDAQINLQIAQFNLANNDTIYKIEEGRYNIGTTTKDKLLQAELQLLRSRQDVTAAKINLQNAKLDLRSFIGLKDGDDFDLMLPQDVPTMQVSVEEALQRAKENRAAYIAFERRKIEAEREVAQARGQRFQVNLMASYGLNNSGEMLENVYQDPLSQQRVNIGFNVPIMDWGRNRARMQTALANKRLNDYVIAQDEINFEQEIITQVSQFEVLMSQIEITRKSDAVAQERYLVSQNRYLIGKIDITNLNIALTEKDTAKRSYMSALRAYWAAYYDLRRLTLFDFSTNQLLYTPSN